MPLLETLRKIVDVIPTRVVVGEYKEEIFEAYDMGYSVQDIAKGIKEEKNLTVGIYSIASYVRNLLAEDGRIERRKRSSDIDDETGIDVDSNNVDSNNVDSNNVDSNNVDSNNVDSNNIDFNDDASNADMSNYNDNEYVEGIVLEDEEIK